MTKFQKMAGQASTRKKKDSSEDIFHISFNHDKWQKTKGKILRRCIS